MDTLPNAVRKLLDVETHLFNAMKDPHSFKYAGAVGEYVLVRDEILKLLKTQEPELKTQEEQELLKTQEEQTQKEQEPETKDSKNENLLRFIAETERKHFRTVADHGANPHSMMFWNMLRKFAGLSELTLDDLPAWCPTCKRYHVKPHISDLETSYLLGRHLTDGSTKICPQCKNMVVKGLGRQYYPGELPFVCSRCEDSRSM
jgi:hypothetical protein